jgi:hypothetical protein
MATTSFFLGGGVDPADGDRTDDLIEYEADDLTTHGVIVGMTGSGKTGLGIIYIEEALRNGIPVLVLDPKGDMTNLLLTFPDLAPADFEPWVDEAEARREDKTVEELATDTAQLWKSGLESWGLGGDQIAELRGSADFTIYTPGSRVGVPLDVLGSLAAPAIDWEEDGEAGRDEIEGVVSGLLALVGVEADPLSSREHILLSNLIEAGWRTGEDLDLETLIGRITTPPIRKLGVFELDSFFPEDDRRELAMRLNALVASPSFADWRSGPPLDPGRLLWDDDGKPQASILYLAHLSEEERQFVVTMVLGRLITWMRSQPGSGRLRALVYMDEVFGFVPPTAAPPAKKPILTLLKQARAFGIGMVLSTQNPVDLDYKAMSNAGTWSIGRLQTERDKARILEALSSASGDVDVDAFDRIVSGLQKRTFLLHNTRDAAPTVFTTRWAMSYLRGPLTRDEVGRLVGDDPRRSESRPVQSNAPTTSDDATTVPPVVAAGIPVAHLDPAAAWASRVGAVTNPSRYRAAVVVRVDLTFDDRAADIDHDESWEAVIIPIADALDPEAAIAVDHDERDLTAERSFGVPYELPDAPIDTAKWWKAARSAITDHLHRHRSIEVYRNSSLKAYSRVGESLSAFEARCRALADEGADADQAKLRDRYENRIRNARDQIDAALEKVRDAELDVETRREEEMMSGAGTIIGVLMGRRSTRSVSSAASKRRQTRTAERRLEKAHDRVGDEMEDLEDLEDALAEDLAEITATWSDRADDIETLEVGLEKTDISIDDLRLVWVPVD